MRGVILILLVISGVFTPLTAQTQEGLASVRHLSHEGQMTKSGERFSHDSLVASHRSIPFGSKVKITNLKTRESVEVKINDRGPFIKGRIIDLSEVAAERINLSHGQVTKVRLEIMTIENNFRPQNSKTQNITGDIFGIQIASYSEMENAINYKTQILKKHDLSVKVKVKPENINGKILYKVYIGNFKTRDEGENYKSQLPQDLKKGYVTTMK